MLQIVTCLLFLEIIVNTESTKPRSVKIALETELSFNNGDKDVKLIDDVQNFLTKIRKVAKVKPSGRRNFNVGNDMKFTDFVKHVIGILKSYNDDDLEDIFAVIDDEARKYHYKDCKFYELLEDFSVRRFVADKLELVKNKPAKLIRENLDKALNVIEDAKFDSKQTEFLDYINSLFTKADCDELKRVLENLETYQRRSKRTDVDLIKMVRDGIRSSVFDHYSGLNSNTRQDFKVKLNSFWKSLVDPHNVNRNMWRYTFHSSFDTTPEASFSKADSYEATDINESPIKKLGIGSDSNKKTKRNPKLITEHEFTIQKKTEVTPIKHDNEKELDVSSSRDSLSNEYKIETSRLKEKPAMFINIDNHKFKTPLKHVKKDLLEEKGKTKRDRREKFSFITLYPEEITYRTKKRRFIIESTTKKSQIQTLWTEEAKKNRAISEEPLISHNFNAEINVKKHKSTLRSKFEKHKKPIDSMSVEIPSEKKSKSSELKSRKNSNVVEKSEDLTRYEIPNRQDSKSSKTKSNENSKEMKNRKKPKKIDVEISKESFEMQRRIDYKSDNMRSDSDRSEEAIHSRATEKKKDRNSSRQRNEREEVYLKSRIMKDNDDMTRIAFKLKSRRGNKRQEIPRKVTTDYVSTKKSEYRDTRRYRNDRSSPSVSKKDMSVKSDNEKPSQSVRGSNNADNITIAVHLLKKLDELEQQLKEFERLVSLSINRKSQQIYLPLDFHKITSRTKEAPRNAKVLRAMETPETTKAPQTKTMLATTATIRTTKSPRATAIQRTTKKPQTTEVPDITKYTHFTETPRTKKVLRVTETPRNTKAPQNTVSRRTTDNSRYPKTPQTTGSLTTTTTAQTSRITQIRTVKSPKIIKYSPTPETPRTTKARAIETPGTTKTPQITTPQTITTTAATKTKIVKTKKLKRKAKNFPNQSKAFQELLTTTSNFKYQIVNESIQDNPKASSFRRDNFNDNTEITREIERDTSSKNTFASTMRSTSLLSTRIYFDDRKLNDDTVLKYNINENSVNHKPNNLNLTHGIVNNASMKPDYNTKFDDDYKETEPDLNNTYGIDYNMTYDDYNETIGPKFDSIDKNYDYKSIGLNLASFRKKFVDINTNILGADDDVEMQKIMKKYNISTIPTTTLNIKDFLTLSVTHEDDRKSEWIKAKLAKDLDHIFERTKPSLTEDKPTQPPDLEYVDPFFDITSGYQQKSENSMKKRLKSTDKSPEEIKNKARSSEEAHKSLSEEGMAIESYEVTPCESYRKSNDPDKFNNTKLVQQRIDNLEKQLQEFRSKVVASEIVLSETESKKYQPLEYWQGTTKSLTTATDTLTTETATTEKATETTTELVKNLTTTTVFRDANETGNDFKADPLSYLVTRKAFDDTSNHKTIKTVVTSPTPTTTTTKNGFFSFKDATDNLIDSFLPKAVTFNSKGIESKPYANAKHKTDFDSINGKIKLNDVAFNHQPRLMTRTKPNDANVESKHSDHNDITIANKENTTPSANEKPDDTEKDLDASIADIMKKYSLPTPKVTYNMEDFVAEFDKMDGNNMDDGVGDLDTILGKSIGYTLAKTTTPALFQANYPGFT